MSRVSMRAFWLGGALAVGLSLTACADNDMKMHEQSLYTRLGGKPAITAVVDQFVSNVAADKRINSFFANTDIPPFTGKDMKAAHAGMGVKDADFNALVEALVAALDKFKVPEKEKGELLGILGPMKGAIVEG